MARQRYTRNASPLIGGPVRYAIDYERAGMVLGWDVSGSFADRSLFDDELTGFTYFSVDPLPHRFYVKLSGAHAHWSPGQEFGWDNTPPEPWPGWNNTPPTPWPGWNNTPPTPWPGWNNTPPTPWPGWDTTPPDPTMAVIQSRTATPYTANVDLTELIPLDDTKPLITEGTEILTVTITPKYASSLMRVRFRGEVSMPHSGACVAALFRAGLTNALRAGYVVIDDTNDVRTLTLEVDDVPAIATPVTYAVRVGPSHGAMRLNGNSVGRLLGGAAAATMVVDEIKT